MIGIKHAPRIQVFFSYINVLYILAPLFNTLIIVKECNLRLNLSHATSIEKFLEIVGDGRRMGSVGAEKTTGGGG